MTHFNIKDDYKVELFLDNFNIKNELEELQVKYGFNEKLNMLRNKIDLIDSNTWKCCRWEINKYDFLVKDPIINRAFYKYWEIVNEFSIFENFAENDIIYHCAEAPGGFIQGSNIFLQLDSMIKKPIILDEIDSGLDVDAIKIICEEINKNIAQNSSLIVITHYPRILNYLKPTHVHIMIEGKIIKTGNMELVEILEKDGYQGIF